MNENNRLFISTGLIKYTESYEAFLGVLAHEIGHLNNFHILKRKESIKNLKRINNIGNLSIIAGSLIGNNQDYVMQSIISNQVGINNYYQAFSRDQEREADIYAIETLNKLGISPNSLIKFLNLLEENSIKKGVNKEYYKFSSHPIYQERYEIINDLRKVKKNYTNQTLNNEFNYIKAKLFGYSENDTKILKEFLNKDYYKYAKSIVLSKQGKLKESLKILNQLIEKKQNYNFLIETKADILYSNGFFKESLLFYKKTTSKNQSNKYSKKRIFDIKFSSIKNQNKINQINFFHKYSFLVQLFFYNSELNKKFIKLSNDNQLNDWINYFSIRENFYNKNINKKKFITDMNKLIKSSSDKNLINLLNHNIILLNENI